MGGYVTFVLAVFLIVLGSTVVGSDPKLFPGPSVNPSAGPGASPEIKYCEAVTPGSAATFEAPQDNTTKCPDGPNGRYVAGGIADNKFEGSTTYQLYRKNVPLNRSFFTHETGKDGKLSDHSILATDAGINTGLDPTKYTLYFPKISGEIKIDQKISSRTRACRNDDGGDTKLLYFVDYGLAFALVLKDGKPIEVKGTDNAGAPATFWVTDVYRDIKRQEIPAEANAFQCDQSRDMSAPGVLAPLPPPGNNNQLQLDFFMFDKTANSVVNGWYDTCKPAIYLYPKEKTLVNVRVKPEGILSYVDPPYDADKGWTVWAQPTGRLTSIHDTRYTIHDYLYYESKIRDEVIKKPKKGYAVKFEELQKLYKDILPKLGLSQAQTKDFIEYWNKALPYSPYYFVGVMDQENVNSFEPLEITPKPDYINRIRIYFERLENPVSVETPDLTVNRSSLTVNDSFRVIEWGGMVKKDKDHPFTCSQ